MTLSIVRRLGVFSVIGVLGGALGLLAGWILTAYASPYMSLAFMTGLQGCW